MMVRIDNAGHRLGGYLPEVGRHLLALFNVHAGIDNDNAVLALDHDYVGQVIPDRAIYVLTDLIYFTCE